MCVCKHTKQLAQTEGYNSTASHEQWSTGISGGGGGGGGGYGTTERTYYYEETESRFTKTGSHYHRFTKTGSRYHRLTKTGSCYHRLTKTGSCFFHAGDDVRGYGTADRAYYYPPQHAGAGGGGGGGAARHQVAPQSQQGYTILGDGTFPCLRANATRSAAPRSDGSCCCCSANGAHTHTNERRSYRRLYRLYRAACVWLQAVATLRR